MRQPNFARLNHVLIPGTKEGRDRIRAGWLGRFSWPLVALYGALTDEGRMLSLLTVIIGGFGIDVRNTELYVLWAMLAGALGASILVRPLYALHHVAVSVAAPRRVLLGEELVFGITIANQGARDLNAIRVSGPFLPWDGRWTSSSGGLARLKPGESARVELRARFVARGEHHLDPFRATALVPMGLAQGRGIETSGTRFLVLPRIARVTKVTLPETRRDQSGGVALASKTGESMELLGVRPYRPGDPIRHLHARTWARTGQPVVREYQEELFRRVAVVLDIDGADEDLAEAAISLAAGVVSQLARGEAIIDLLVAGERVHDLTLGRNIGFLEQALELLACVEQKAPAARADGKAAPAPAPENHSPALLAQLEPHFGRLSSVVLVDAGTRSESIGGRARGPPARATAESIGGRARSTPALSPSESIGGRARSTPALSPSESIVARTRASGTGCLWLRVERGSRGARKAHPGAGQGAVVVRADAVQRGEELVL